ncbi:MAG: ester cyclase [Ignavibacteriales bacterium]|nr:ester cyclase [Ignavibacteriales bacterium]
MSNKEISIRERLTANITPELYDKIRHLWIKHSQAEDRRNIEGLIETLTEECVYEIIPTGEQWEGHDGARQFYLTFLGAFPDVRFNLTDIVIGPQGAFEVADLVGTHKGVWAGVQPTGKSVNLKILIYFPWNSEREKFDGEKVYFDRMQLEEQAK